MNYPPPPGPPHQGPPPDNYGPPPGPPGQWGPPPQQPWSPGPPPKKGGNGWKWALGGVALLAVIGVTAAVTISVTSKGGNEASPAPLGETYGLASAGDTGPVNIITQDPSCAAWLPIQTTLAKSQGAWADRDPSIPASSWTPQQRAQYDVVRKAYREAADQTMRLVKVTPHRVVRELYEQFIAYSRAYINAIATYTPDDDYLSGVATASSAALGYICGAITYGSAGARAPLVEAPTPPEATAPLQNPEHSQRFLTATDATCAELGPLLDQFSADTKAWQALDARRAASDWTPQERAIIDAVIPVMKTFADNVEALGRRTDNPVTQDLSVLAAQYRRAYAEALPTYTSADSYLTRASNRTTAVIYDACRAVSG